MRFGFNTENKVTYAKGRGGEENARQRDQHVQRPSGQRQHVTFQEWQEDLRKEIIIILQDETRGAGGSQTP